MRQIIRSGTFETNSSSMHSLVVLKDPYPYTSCEKSFGDASDEYYVFYDEEEYFGRSPFMILKTPSDKLKYYVAKKLNNASKEEKLSIINDIKSLVSKYTQISKNRIHVDALIKDYPHTKPYYSGIEHNDTGEDPFEYLYKNNISLEEFVMNPKYIIFVDGDEYRETEKLFMSGLIDDNNIEYFSLSSLTEFNKELLYVHNNWFSESLDCVGFSYLDNINKFTKEVMIENDYYSSGEFILHSDEIKMFIEQAKKTKNDLKFTLKIVNIASASKSEKSKINELKKLFDNYEEIGL